MGRGNGNEFCGISLQLSYDPELPVLFVFISVSLSIYILISVYSEMPVFMCMCTWTQMCTYEHIYFSGLLTGKTLEASTLVEGSDVVRKLSMNAKTGA